MKNVGQQITVPRLLLDVLVVRYLLVQGWNVGDGSPDAMLGMVEDLSQGELISLLLRVIRQAECGNRDSA